MQFCRNKFALFSKMGKRSNTLCLTSFHSKKTGKFIRKTNLSLTATPEEGGVVLLLSEIVPKGFKGVSFGGRLVDNSSECIGVVARYRVQQYNRAGVESWGDGRKRVVRSLLICGVPVTVGNRPENRVKAYRGNEL